jgi:hypothetical protein
MSGRQAGRQAGEHETEIQTFGHWNRGDYKETTLVMKEQSLFKLTITQSVKIFHVLN